MAPLQNTGSRDVGRRLDARSAPALAAPQYPAACPSLRLSEAPA